MWAARGHRRLVVRLISAFLLLGAGTAGAAGIDWPTSEDVWEVVTLRNWNTRIVVASTTLLGITAGIVGTFLLLRRRSLMGDALSHATLPGIGLAFLGGGRGWVPAPLARASTVPANLVQGSSRGLGWDALRRGGWGGSAISPRAFGHTGFTGTSILCDPRYDLCVVLLTNRVHPTRDNSRITGVRRALHDLVIGAMER